MFLKFFFIFSYIFISIKQGESLKPSENTSNPFDYFGNFLNTISNGLTHMIENSKKNSFYDVKSV